MHPAPAFAVTDRALLLATLARYPFATLAAAPDGSPRVAHAPVTIVEAEGALTLEFHLAARNGLAPFVAAGFHAIAVALGPHAYVSPDWYADPTDQVPTWDYVSVEAEGWVSPMGSDDTAAQLDALALKLEGGMAKEPWSTARISREMHARLTRAIVGCRMRVERLEGTFKLGQNKSEADRAGVLAALRDDPISEWLSL
jgi:transcriptional regulator